VTSYFARQARALARIDLVNRRFNWSIESKSATTGAVRHKCFVSYHSADAEEAANFVESFEDIFIPRAIGVEEGDGSVIDSGNVDYIRDVIRRDYLRDSTVTIVLVGRCTWARKFVDWELYASLRDTSTSNKNGLLGILLPSATDTLPTAPERLRENIPDGAMDAYGRYRYYPTSSAVLQGYIEDAFQARKTRGHLINNARLPRKRNTSCP
jgi:hypothetical protein